MKISRAYETLEQICHQHRLRALYAFGSRAPEARRFTYGQQEHLAPGPADLDLAVLPAEGRRLGVDEKVDLMAQLEDFFQVGRVDLVLLPEADPFLAANIIRGERLYAMDETDIDEFDLFVLRRAGDLIPLERERLSLVLGDA